MAVQGENRKRAAALLGGVAATAGLAILAFGLGAWGFGLRRFSQHEARLRRLAALQPRLEQVVLGLNDEGSLLVGAPRDAAQLTRVAEERGGARRAEVLAKGRRFAHTRVFVAADMVYFVYFDEAGVMRDFTCVGR